MDSPGKLIRRRENPLNLSAGIPALDGIRGLAVLAVIASHLPVLFGYRQVTPWAQVNRVIAGGFLGVDVFFVLSGFLITSLLLREYSISGRVNLKHFFIRRAIRLLPALYLLLIIDFVIALLNGTSLSGQWNITWATILNLNNWYFVFPILRHGPADFKSNLGHLWSLSVEEQFYLFWPAVLIVFVKWQKTRSFLPVLIAILISLVMLRRIILWQEDVSYLVILIRTDARLDSLLVGALMAFGFRDLLIDQRVLRVCAYVSLPIFFGLAFQGPGSSLLDSVGFTLVALVAMIMIYASVENAWGLCRLFEVRWLVFVGKISYGLYLWHFVIFDFISSNVGTDSRFLRSTFAFMAVLATTLFSWFYVEKPLLLLKERKYGHAARD